MTQLGTQKQKVSEFKNHALNDKEAEFTTQIWRDENGQHYRKMIFWQRITVEEAKELETSNG